MLEALVEKLLLAKLGKFIHELDAHTLRVGLWAGDIVMENVLLKSDVLLLLGVPLTIAYGVVQRLVVHVPWRKLTSEPVVLSLEGLCVLVLPDRESDEELLRQRELTKKKEVLQALEQSLQQQDEGSPSYFAGLVRTVLSNMKVTLSGISVRFEHSSDSGRVFAGFTLDTVEFITTNNLWEKAFVSEGDTTHKFKVLEVSALRVYLTNDNRMEGLDSQSIRNYLSAIVISPEPDVLFEVNAKVLVKQTLTEPETYWAQLVLPELSVTLSQVQYCHLIKLLEVFAEHNKAQVKTDKLKKFQALSPQVRTPAHLWAFAGGCVRKLIRQQKDRSQDLFTEEARTISRKLFTDLYTKARTSNTLTVREQRLFDKVLHVSEDSDLIAWARAVLANRQPSVGLFNPTKAVAEPESAYLKSQTWLVGVFQLNKVSVHCTDLNEEFRLEISGFDLDFKQRIVGADIIIKLQDFELQAMSAGTLHKICQKLQVNNELPLMRLDMRLSPFEVDCASYTVFSGQPLDIEYSSDVIKQGLRFFAVPAVGESLKTAAWSQVQTLQDSSQAWLFEVLSSPRRHLIDVDISGPSIRMECLSGELVLNCGKLRINNQTAQSNKPETYALTITGVTFGITGDFGMQIIPPCCLKVNLAFETSPESNKVIATASSEDLSVFLQPSVHAELQDAYERLLLELQLMKMANIRAQDIYELSVLRSTARKQDDKLQTWFSYEAVLSGSYVYFFDDPQHVATYFYLKDCSVIDFSSAVLAPYVLRLSNRFGHCTFELGDSDTFEQWKGLLTQTIVEIESSASVAAQDSHSTSEITLQLDKMSIFLQSEEADPLSTIRLLSFKAFSLATQSEFTLDVELGQLEIFNTQNCPTQFNYLVHTNPNKPAIDLSLVYFSPESVHLQDKDLILSLTLGDWDVLWNADQISAYLDFFKIGKSPTRQRKVKDPRLQSHHTLLQLHFEAEKLQLSMNIPENEIVLASLSVKQLSGTTIIKNEGYHIDFKAKELEVKDLSNYPKTAGTHSVETTRLVSTPAARKTAFVGSLRKGMDEQGWSLSMQVHSLELVYLHQPIMRLVDFFNNRIQEPLAAENSLKNTQIWSSLTKVATWLRVPNRLDRSETQAFNHLNFTFENPTILLKPRPSSPAFFRLDCSSISVANARTSSSTRHASLIVPTDLFSVNVDHLQISLKEEVILLPCDFKLFLEKPVTDNALEQDRRYILTGESTDLGLTLRQSDYTILLSLFDLNLAYDDKLDSLLSSAPENFIDSSGNVFLETSLTMPSISVILKHETVPLAELYASESVIAIEKLYDDCMDIAFTAKCFQGLLPDGVVSETNIFTPPIVGTPRFNQTLFSTSCTDFFKFTMNKTPEGAKAMKFCLPGSRINLHFPLFQQLQAFFYYGMPEYRDSVETPYDYLKYPFCIDHPTVYAPHLKVEVVMPHSVIVLPSSCTDRVLVCQSSIDFTYFREDEQLANTGSRSASMKQLNAQELEVYTCQLAELELQFDSTKQRCILKPVQCLVQSIESLNRPYQSSFHIKIQSGRIKLIVSKEDCWLAQQAFVYQTSKNAECREVNQALAVARLYAPASELLEYEDVDLPSQRPVKQVLSTLTTYAVADISLLVLNDIAGGYSPLFELIMQEFEALSIDTQRNWHLVVGSVIRIDFFNPVVNRWDPFVEGFKWRVETETSPELQPQTETLIQTGPITITLTEHMMKYMKTVLTAWKQERGPATESVEVVTPLSIRNNCGHSILSQKTFAGNNASEPVEIQSGSEFDYLTDPNLARRLNLTKETLSLSLIISQELSNPLELTPISNQQSMLCEVTVGPRTYPVVVDPKMEGTKKVLEVRSPLLVRNNTKVAVHMMIREESEIEFRECTYFTAVPVPVKYLTGRLGFFSPNETHNIVSEFNILSDLILRKKRTTEVRIGGHYLALRYIQHSDLEQVIYLTCPFVIKNRMPTAVKLTVYNENQAELSSFLLHMGRDKSLYFKSKAMNYSFSASLPGFPDQLTCVPFGKTVSTSKSVLIYDEHGQPTKMCLHVRRNASFELILSPAVSLVNNTLTAMRFFSKRTGMVKPIPVHGKITPTSHIRKLSIEVEGERSSFFKVNSIGMKSVVGVHHRATGRWYQFVYDVQLTQVIPDDVIFTRVVTISPRFVIQNELANPIFLRQNGSTAAPLQLLSRSRTPFHWFEFTDGEPLLQMKEHNQWHWTGAFSIANIGNFTIQSKHKSRFSAFKLFKVSIEMLNSSICISIDREDEDSCPYHITNNSHAVTIKVHQRGYPQDMRLLHPQSSQAFAWTQPHREHFVTLQVIRVGSELEYSFNFDQNQQHFKVNLAEGTVYISIYTHSLTKILEVSDSMSRSRVEEAESVMNSLTVRVPNFGVSIVEQANGNSEELLYFTMKNIEAIINTMPSSKQVQLQIAWLQIDNQLTECPAFPVLLHSDPESSQPVFDLSFEMRTNSLPEHYEFKYAELLVQPLWLNLDNSIASSLLQFTSRIFFENQPVHQSVDLYHKFAVTTWKTALIQHERTRFYFGSFKVCPIKLSCSYLPTTRVNSETELGEFRAVRKALGLSILSLEDAPIKFYTVEMHDFNGLRSQILSAVLHHYKSQLTTQVLKLVGHSVILSSPVGLFKNLGTGVYDFFYEPVHGIIKGPLAAGKGLIKGTTSLFTNTIQGTFGTISKLTGSLATGIAELTQSRRYRLQRRLSQALNKPQDLVEGLGAGLQRFFENFGQGFTGFVTEPLAGYNKRRGRGAMRGAIRGVTGIVLKPIIGVFDMVSTTAEGVKNTTCKHEVVQRERCPRALYGSLQLIRPFDEADAEAQSFLRRLRDRRFLSCKLVGQCVSRDYRNQVWLFAVTVETIVLADIRTSKVLWLVPTRDLQQYEVRDRVGVILLTRPSHEAKTEGQTVFLVPFRRQVALRVCKQILNSLLDYQ